MAVVSGPGLSRRAFLGSLAALAIASAAGCGLQEMGELQRIGPGSADLVPPDRSGGAGAGAPAAGARTPFAVSSESVLSEDHFLLAASTFDPAQDRVVSYVHDDAGLLEAMIVQGDASGLLSQLAHDPQNANEWVLKPVRLTGSDTDLDGIGDVVAGRPLTGSGDVGVLHVFAQTASTVLHLIQTPDRMWTAVDLKLPPPSLEYDERLQMSDGPNGSLLAYWVVPKPGLYGSTIYWCDVDASSGSEVVRIGSIELGVMPYLGTVARMSRASGHLQLYCWSTADNFAPFWAKIADVDETDTGFQPLTGTVLTPPQSGPKSPPILRSLCAVDESQPPFAVAENSTGVWLLFYDPSAPPATAFRYQQIWQRTQTRWQYLFTGIRTLPLPAQDADPSKVTTRVIDIYLPTDTSLWVMRQQSAGNPVQDSTQPQFSPALALQGGIAAVPTSYSTSAVSLPTTPGTGTGMMFIDTSGVLQTLLQDQASGVWTSSPVHRSAGEAVELTIYRTRFSITDDWGAPVVASEVSLTAAVPTLALINEQTATLSPGTPVVATTNAAGQITVATPATGLGAPAITLAVDGLKTPSSVEPAAPVNAYFSGTTTLNNLPVLTSDVLAKAPIGSVDSADSGTAFTLISSSAKAGIPQAQRVGAQRQIPLAPRGAEHPRASTTLTVAGVDWHIQDFFNEVVQGVKTGAAEISGAIQSVKATVAQWAVDIKVTCGDFVDQILTITVNTLDDAAHAVGAVLTWIGAKIDAAIDWLKAEIFAVLKDSWTVAQRLKTQVLLPAPGHLQTLVGQAQAKLTNAFQNLDQKVDGAFDALETKLGGDKATLSSLASSTSLLTSRVESPGAEDAPGPGAGTGHSNWLMDKLRSVITGPTVKGGITFDTAAFDGLGDLFAPAGTELKTAMQDLWQAIKAAFSNPKDLLSYPLKPLLDAARNLIKGILDLAGDIAAGLLIGVNAALGAFTSLLELEITGLPLVGSILSAAGITTPLTVGDLVCLIVAFPLTVWYKIKNGSAAIPLDELSGAEAGAPAHGSGQQLGIDPTAANMLAAAAFVNEIWAISDANEAFFAAEREGSPSVNNLAAWFDIICPALMMGLVPPVSNGDGTPWDNAAPNSEGEVWSYLSWATGAAGLAVALYGWYEQESLEDREKFDEISDLVAAINGGLGVWSLYTGVISNGLTDPGGLTWASTLTGGIVGLAQFGAIGETIVATSEVSPYVAATLIGGGGTATTVMLGLQAAGYS